MKPSRTELYRKQKTRVSALREARSEAAPYRVRTGGADERDDAVPAHPLLAGFIEEDAEQDALLQAGVSVSAEESAELLDSIRAGWDAQRMDELLDDCRKAVLHAITGPFGLGSVAAAADKVGGNVTTVHNARQDIYARPEDGYRREEYTGAAYKAARGKYADSKIEPNSQMVVDEYSGEAVDYSQADCDHIVSVKGYHQDGGFKQDKKRKAAFGADPDNFAMTAGSANRSKQDKGFDEWHNSTASDGSGRNNKERHGHDNRRVKPAVRRGEQAAARHAPTLGEKSAYYGKRAAATGAAEAGKTGMRQALGLLLVEFLTASFDEILDAYKRGMRADTHKATFFEALRTRLARIASRVAARWKDAMQAFKDGAISGFLGNLVTMLINMLVTTGKRVVRVIREGMLSILSAFKLVLFPPKGMTRAEAGDAALKLLAAGTVTSLGILAEEAAEKAITAFFTSHLPMLAPAAGPVAAVLVATMTGIASALLVYWIERLDVFGVRRKRSHARIMRELDDAIEQGDLRIDAIYDSVMNDPDWELLSPG